METRILVLNGDPVFQDRALGIFDSLDNLETRIVRTLAEGIQALLAENFDAFIIEGEPEAAFDQATHARQHFPSLRIACLIMERGSSEMQGAALQNIDLIIQSRRRHGLHSRLATFVRSLEVHGGPSTEGIDPCHSLVGNLSQFPAAEILQMSCLSQRSGRFTFKSGRGNSEIYLQQGAVRHATFGSLEGEPVVAEIFRWRQGRFYFEEGVISQVQSVDRPWPHLLIDNLQKLDETLELVSVP
ncbi:MAG TPA: DUF4388 domain-containing protein [Chthoniobacterales bacterium]|nr:DUF4388 domain-containing protein [Chthoniobacterales bacterium]